MRETFWVVFVVRNLRTGSRWRKWVFKMPLLRPTLSKTSTFLLLRSNFRWYFLSTSGAENNLLLSSICLKDCNSGTSRKWLPVINNVFSESVLILLSNLIHISAFPHRFRIQDLIHWPQETLLQWPRQPRHLAWSWLVQLRANFTQLVGIICCMLLWIQEACNM